MIRTGVRGSEGLDLILKCSNAFDRKTSISFHSSLILHNNDYKYLFIYFYIRNNSGSV